MVGFSQGYEEVVLRGSFKAHSFIQFYLRGGRVIAADSVNRAADFMQAKRLIAEGGLGLTAAQLADESRALRAWMEALL
ncbi:Putidaredoxin reductase [compost metagenome]